MDQPGGVANPVRGQLKKEKKYQVFLCPRSSLRIWSCERRVRPSLPASACSFSTLKPNLVLTRRISPDFRVGVHLLIPPTALESVPSLSGHTITYRWRSLSRVRQYRASSPRGSSSNGCCLFRYHHHGPINVHLSFPTPAQHVNVMSNTESMGGTTLFSVGSYYVMSSFQSRPCSFRRCHLRLDY